MNDRFIVGIAGKARSGKDTLAEVFVDNGFRRSALADQMKTILSLVFPNWTADHMFGDLKECVDPEWGFSPRKAMQIFGTEFGRHLSEDLWIKRFDKLHPTGKIVVPDIRFENEAAWVRKNGVLIHVHRENLPKVEAHSSEAGVEYGLIDHMFFNDGSLEDLNYWGTALVDEILAQKGDTDET